MFVRGLWEVMYSCKGREVDGSRIVAVKFLYDGILKGGEGGVRWKICGTNGTIYGNLKMQI